MSAVKEVPVNTPGAIQPAPAGLPIEPVSLVVAPTVERFGLKRTYMLFMGSRNFVLCGMILLPWMIAGLGPDLALMYAVGVMGSYGLLRIIAETALYPWMLESVPNSVRGKYTAVSTMAATASRRKSGGRGSSTSRR